MRCPAGTSLLLLAFYLGSLFFQFLYSKSWFFYLLMRLMRGLQTSRHTLIWTCGRFVAVALALRWNRERILWALALGLLPTMSGQFVSMTKYGSGHISGLCRRYFSAKFSIQSTFIDRYLCVRTVQNLASDSADNLLVGRLFYEQKSFYFFWMRAVCA